MKKIYFLLLFILFFTENFAQKKEPLVPFTPTNSNSRVAAIDACVRLQNPANLVCSNGSIVYAAPVNDYTSQAPISTQWDCLRTYPNQDWFIVTVITAGNLAFEFSNSNNVDIDAIIWGPVSGGNMANACTTITNAPVSCDYDPYRPNLTINNAQVGSKYIMCVTNYSNAANTITISQPTGGAVQYCALRGTASCTTPVTASIYHTLRSSSNDYILAGNMAPLGISFTGVSPWTYKLSNGITGTSTNNSTFENVTPTENTTYTITSVTDGCGATGGGIGSVILKPINDKALISCFPFDGSATDQTGINNSYYSNQVYTNDRAGSANKAVEIQNSSQVFSCPANNIKTSSYSYSVWLKPYNLPQTLLANKKSVLKVGFYYFGNGSSWRGQGIDIEYSQSLQKPVITFLSHGDQNGLIISKVSTDKVYANEWHHYIFARTKNTMKIYVDGVLEESKMVTSKVYYELPNNQITVPASSSCTMEVGSEGYTGNRFFYSGAIDQLKIFRGTLSDEEILTLYNNETCSFELQGDKSASLITCLPFDNGASDRYGTVNATVNNASLTTGRGGLANTAYEFNGNNSSITLNKASQYVNDSYTFSAWVYPYSLSTSTVKCPIFSVGNADSLQSISISGSTPAWTFTATDSVSTKTLLYNQKIFINQWQHLVIMSSKKQLKMYWNGVLVASQAVANNVYPLFSNNPLATIGMSGNSYFNGKIDDVKLFSGTLTDSEIQTLYNANNCDFNNANAGQLDTELLACYSLDNTANDSYSTLNGTLINNPTAIPDRNNVSNKALRFNGIDNYMVLPLEAFPGSIYTISFWINKDVPYNLFDYYDKKVFSMCHGTDEQSFELTNNGSMMWRFSSNIGGAINNITVPYATLAENTWYHIICTRSLNTMKLFINGVLRGTKTISGGVNYNYRNPVIGASRDSYGDIKYSSLFKGKIDDFKIFRGMIYDDEISSLYNTTTCNYKKCPPSLIIQNTISTSGQYNASKVIQAKNSITNNSNVLYSAGKDIIISPTFRVDNNSVFSTVISGCPN